MLRSLLVFAAVVGSALAFAPPTLPQLQLRSAKTHSITMMGKQAKDGVFTPVVKAARAVLGDSTLTKVRGNVIAKHSAVIKAFCDTAESPVGQVTLRQLYKLADRDGNGVLDKEELRDALNFLGFTHLGDDAIDRIFARADKDGDTFIGYDEFMEEAPKTLRTNLTTLAKTNGNELGFLS